MKTQTRAKHYYRTEYDDRIAPHLEAAARRYYRQGYGGRIAPNLEDWYPYAALSPIVAENKLDLIREHHHIETGTHILEIGSGLGTFLRICTEAGYTAIGIDPNEFFGEQEPISALEIAQSQGCHDLVAGYGERLPFPSDTFDVVASFQVLEHVRDPEQVLREAYRVLQPGGIAFVKCPNFILFHEAHYNLPWLPLLPKPIARVYVRLLGKDPAFLDHLNYTTPRRVERMLKAIGCQYHDEAPDFVENRINGDLDQITLPVYRKLAKIIRALHLTWIAELITRIGWISPVRFAIYK